MRSADGRRGGGRSLKKSPVEGPNHCICRRERFERTAAPLQDLVSSRANSGASIPLQLEDDFGDCGHHLVDLLLPAVSWNNPKSSSGGVLDAPDAPNSRRSSCYLGRAPQPSKSFGPGFRSGNQWANRNRVLARLCSGTQPGGVYLGTLETT